MEPEMSSTTDGYVSVAWYSGAPLSSVVKIRRCANGSQVDPSMSPSGAPVLSVAASTVTLWAASASRFTRVIIAGRPGLVPLEQEVRAVVIGGVRAGLSVEDQVRVLVGLGLRGLDQVRGAGQVARRRNSGPSPS